MLGIINVIATDSGLAAGIWVAQASRLLLKVLSLSKEPPPCSRQNELFLTGGMALTNARFEKVRAGETPAPTGETPVLPTSLLEGRYHCSGIDIFSAIPFFSVF